MLPPSTFTARWIELMSIASRPQLPVATLCRQATELVRTVIVDSFHDPSTDADRSWKELETPGIQHHVKCRKYTRRRPLTGLRAVGGIASYRIAALQGITPRLACMSTM